MTFPVMNRTRGAYGDPVPGCPNSVPLALVTPHEQQALRNHSQTLKRLADRGGLSPEELYYVLRDERLPVSGFVSKEGAIQYLNTRLSLFLEPPKP